MNLNGNDSLEYPEFSRILNARRAHKDGTFKYVPDEQGAALEWYWNYFAHNGKEMNHQQFRGAFRHKNEGGEFKNSLQGRYA